MSTEPRCTCGPGYLALAPKHHKQSRPVRQEIREVARG